MHGPRQAGTWLLGLLGLGLPAAQTRVLFVGDSFTHGKYAPVLGYNAACVLFYWLTGRAPRTLGAGEQAAAAAQTTKEQRRGLYLVRGVGWGYPLVTG